jgi:hypothetical protein
MRVLGVYDLSQEEVVLAFEVIDNSAVLSWIGDQ